MSYVVKREENEIKLMENGEHEAKIKYWKFREFNNDGILFNNISLTWENDLGEIMWDTIFQNVDEEKNILVYDEKKMNRYSKVFNIPEGTAFATIEEWLDFIAGNKVIVVVDEKNGRKRVAYIKGIKDGNEPF